MPGYELAQLNIAKLLAPIDSPRLAEFVANLERINALADGAPGFVWRLQTEEGDATSIRTFGADYIVNLSVWQDIASLHSFVYRSAHIEVMRKRKAWFEKMVEAYAVLWWVPEGHRPTVEEAQAKLELLRRNGVSPDAFTFKKPYPKPGEGSEVSAALDDACPAC